MIEVTPGAIQVLLDKDAIKEVLYKFDYLSDDGDAVGAVDRYCTDDVKFDGGVLGTAEGKDAFKESAKELPRHRRSLRSRIEGEQVLYEHPAEATT